MDYYKVLRILPSASEKEIKTAYRKLAKEYHPDVVGEDQQKKQQMYEIQEAYRILSDPGQRKDYDEKRQRSEEQHREERTGPSPDQSAFERFFGFQPGKGMETYKRQRQPDKKEGKAGTEGPMKPEERFASFFERIR